MAVKPIVLKASSLVETLVSMVIILIVFGIGMLIFVNLTKATKSETKKSTAEQMAAWSHQLEADGLDGNTTGEVNQDSIMLSYRLSELPEYPDRLRLTVYSIHPQAGNITDSLVRYIENKTESGGQQ